MDYIRKELRDLSHIQRWQYIRTIRQQNLAEHSYYVVVYATKIAKCVKMDPMYWEQLVEYAMAHDWDELITGDIASPGKQLIKHELSKVPYSPPDGAAIRVGTATRTDGGSPWPPDTIRRATEDVTGTPLGEIMPIVKFIVKTADLLEMVLFLVDEIKLGNTEVKSLFKQWEDNLYDYIFDSKYDVNDELLTMIKHTVFLGFREPKLR